MTNAETSSRAAASPAQVAPTAPPTAMKAAGRKKRAPQSHKPAQSGKAATATETKASSRNRAVKSPHPAPSLALRAGSKSAKILAMIGQTQGATIASIMKATQWQAHSVRSFLSVAAQKHHLKIEAAQNAAGDRVYRIVQ
jgi:hypothetical protein